jgi:hypothetical protein
MTEKSENIAEEPQAMENADEPTEVPLEEQLERVPPKTVVSDNEDFETNATINGYSSPTMVDSR